jgi:hypothetical protein
VIDGRLDDSVRRVEVVMSQPISHSGHVLPRNLRLPLEESRVDPLDRLPDLDQSKSHGVEDETVVQASPLEVASDSLDGFDDVR